MTEKVRVVIVVSGGVVQAVYAGDFVQVVLHDEDELESLEEDGRTYGPCIYPHDGWDKDAQALWDQAVDEVEFA